MTQDGRADIIDADRARQLFDDACQYLDRHWDSIIAEAAAARATTGLMQSMGTTNAAVLRDRMRKTCKDIDRILGDVREAIGILNDACASLAAHPSKVAAK